MVFIRHNRKSLVSPVGWKYFIYFFSLGYGYGVAALAITIAILFWGSITPTTAVPTTWARSSYGQAVSSAVLARGSLCGNGSLPPSATSASLCDVQRRAPSRAAPKRGLRRQSRISGLRQEDPDSDSLAADLFFGEVQVAAGVKEAYHCILPISVSFTNWYASNGSKEIPGRSNPIVSPKNSSSFILASILFTNCL